MPKQLPLFSLLLLPIVGCLDASEEDEPVDDRTDCERASDIVNQRYRECELKVEPGDDTNAPECTPDLGSQSLCVAACVEAATCAALDGTDADASRDLATCYVDCI